jgi:hypothetical protein
MLAIADHVLYGGLEAEVGRVYDRVDPVPDTTLYGLAAFVGGRTAFGTVTLGFGRATGSWAFWLTLGRPIGSGAIVDQPLFR